MLGPWLTAPSSHTYTHTHVHIPASHTCIHNLRFTYTFIQFTHIYTHNHTHTPGPQTVYTHTALTCSHTHVYIEQTYTPGLTCLHTHGHTQHTTSNHTYRPDLTHSQSTHTQRSHMLTHSHVYTRIHSTHKHTLNPVRALFSSRRRAR